MPPAGALRLRDGGGRRAGAGWFVVEVGGGAPIPPAIDPGKPSRRGPWRPGRSSSWALHLDARARACSTSVWVDGRRDGSRAQGRAAGPCRRARSVRLAYDACIGLRGQWLIRAPPSEAAVTRTDSAKVAVEQYCCLWSARWRIGQVDVDVIPSLKVLRQGFIPGQPSGVAIPAQQSPHTLPTR